MALQDTKNRKLVGTDGGFNIYEVTVTKGDREDTIKVNVPASPDVAKKNDPDFWNLFERQFISDASNAHRSTGMISEEERREKLRSQVQKLKESGMSEKDILSLLKD